MPAFEAHFSLCFAASSTGNQACVLLFVLFSICVAFPAFDAAKREESEQGRAHRISLASLSLDATCPLVFWQSCLYARVHTFCTQVELYGIAQFKGDFLGSICEKNSIFT